MRDGAGVQPQRPRVLAVLCVLGWVGVAVAVAALIFRPNAIAEASPAQLVAGTIALAGSALALAGYWLLKRWGIWLAAAAAVARVVTGGLDLFPLRLTDLVWPAVIVAVGLLYIRRLG